MQPSQRFLHQKEHTKSLHQVRLEVLVILCFLDYLERKNHFLFLNQGYLPNQRPNAKNIQLLLSEDLTKYELNDTGARSGICYTLKTLPETSWNGMAPNSFQI